MESPRSPALHRSPAFPRKQQPPDSPRFPAAVPRGCRSFDEERYVQLKELHGGKWSSVYLAQDTVDKKKVVLKYQSEDHCTQAEKGALELLGHCNVVKLLHSDPIENRLVLEYVKGQDLFDWTVEFHEDGELSLSKPEIEKAIVPICSQIHSALLYCHSAGVAHRDVKLENIMIDGKKNIKLIDFGFSYVVGVTDDPERYCGSREYAPPELVKKKPLGKESPFRADAWSFGVVIYILTHYAFPCGSDDLKFDMVAPNREFSRPMRRLIASLLDKNPSTRALISDVETTWLKKGTLGECQE